MNVLRYDDRPVTNVLQNIVSNIQEIIRSEVQPAKGGSILATRARTFLAEQYELTERETNNSANGPHRPLPGSQM